MSDYGDLDTSDKLVLMSRAMSARMDGKDGFLEAIQAADGMVKMKKDKKEKEHTAGFLKAVLDGEDPGMAFKAFPGTNQGMVQGFLAQAMADKRTIAAEGRGVTRQIDAEKRAQTGQREDETARLAVAIQEEQRKRGLVEQDAMDVQSQRANVGAEGLLQGQAPVPGLEPPSIDQADAGFLAQISAGQQLPPGRAAIAKQAAREQMAKERAGEADIAGKQALAENREALATRALAEAARADRAESKLAEVSGFLDEIRKNNGQLPNGVPTPAAKEGIKVASDLIKQDNSQKATASEGSKNRSSREGTAAAGRATSERGQDKSAETAEQSRRAQAEQQAKAAAQASLDKLKTFWRGKTIDPETAAAIKTEMRRLQAAGAK